MINDKRIKTLMASIFCLVCVVIIVLCINIGKEKENSGNDSEGINVTEEAPVVEETPVEAPVEAPVAEEAPATEEVAEEPAVEEIVIEENEPVANEEDFAE